MATILGIIGGVFAFVAVGFIGFWLWIVSMKRWD